MRLAEDDRGRVPFALIAALLLVASLTYTAGFVHESPRDPVAPRVVETAVQQARLHLATAARAADRTAAREPVLEAADTPTGRLLADDPFRDALRLRIAVRVRRAIGASRSADGTTARVHLPPITDPASTGRALDAVSLEPLDEDRVRVTVANATVRVTRHGRVVEERPTNLSATVSLPAVALHDRVRDFERRLTAGVVDPGLARSLTTRLYALAWVRGYAQYGGAPISNVVANRHVGLLTNDALLAQQAATFGRADAAARRAEARAAAQVAVADGAAGIDNALSSRLEAASSSSRGQAATLGAVDMPAAMDEPRSIGVDRSADAAFVDFLDARGRNGFDRAVRAAYRARIRPTTSVDRGRTRVTHRGSRPPNATFGFTVPHTDYQVSGSGHRTASGATLLRYDRAVTVTRTERRYWFENASTYLGSTATTRERTDRVTVRVRCRYDRPSIAPSRPVAGDCPFGDDARADLVDRAAARLGSRYGGADAVARAAVSGHDGFGWSGVAVEPPAAARRRAYESAAALRESVRGITIDATPLSIASRSNPASKLARAVRRRHASLVDAPSTYGSAAAVAASAARTAYLGSLDDTLDGHSSSLADVQANLGDVLASHAVPKAPPKGAAKERPPIATRVDADPRYLSLSATPSGDEPPLATRNLNLFTVPYGDVADTVAGAIGGDDGSASLAAATDTLAATNRALSNRSDTDLRRRRNRLRAAIRRSLDAVRRDQRRALTNAPGVSRGAAVRAVEAGYDRYGSVVDRARAVTDGPIAARIAASLPGGLSAVDRDRARVELRMATLDARSAASVRVDRSTVGVAADRVRPMVRDGVEQAARVGTRRAADAARRRAFDGAAASLPAGLPVLPIPGQWYATANVWVVSVRGGYRRFAVHAARGTPATNGSVTYVRRDATVTLDVDGDGHAAVLGRDTPIELSADTGVVVVVPPGERGVGDKDGNADERSPGW